MIDKLPTAASNIILGTMRLHESTRTVEEWVDFFWDVYALGVRKLHCSREYDSYPLLLRILDQLRAHDPAVTFAYMVKLAEPSFDDTGFEASRLEDRIEEYRRDLNIDMIDDVQWMWRSELKNDIARIANFDDHQEELSRAFAGHRANGRVKRFLCFPYSSEFAFAALECDGLDGLVVYRNIAEREYDGAIEACATMGKRTVIIRPFNAGSALDSSRTPRALVDFALDKPGIESAILSTSKLSHIQELLT